MLQAAMFSNRTVRVEPTQTYIPQFSNYEQKPATVVTQAPAGQTPSFAPKAGSLVYDPATGKYVRTGAPAEAAPASAPQEEVYDLQPVVPTQQMAPQYQLTVKEQQELLKQQKKEAQELAKLEKERKAEERRAYMDQLREESAARARKNDSVLGRVMNSAVGSVGRELGRTLTRGVLGALTGSKK